MFLAIAALVLIGTQACVITRRGGPEWGFVAFMLCFGSLTGSLISLLCLNPTVVVQHHIFIEPFQPLVGTLEI